VGAGLLLIAGAVLVVGGFGAILARRRLADAVVRMLGQRGSGSGSAMDPKLAANIILVAGVVLIAWGGWLLVWGWMETDFIDVPEDRGASD
jgi:hypothetical protein